MKQLMQKIYGCDVEQNGTNIIRNALIWAAAILVASWLTRDSAHSESIVMMMIVLSTVIFVIPNRKKDSD